LIVDITDADLANFKEKIAVNKGRWWTSPEPG